MPPLNKEIQRISLLDYLDGELKADIKHEYIDGYAFAMAGASKNHERISINLLSDIKNSEAAHEKRPI